MIKKALIIIAVIIGIIIVGTAGYGYFLYNSIAETVAGIHEPMERDFQTSKRSIEVSIEKNDPLSFLLLGVDATNLERGRSDTIIVITVNPNTNSMLMLSLPRDTRTNIIGKGFEDKINHAYAFGGAKMSVETVESFLNIPIDHFISVNMESFKEIVDALGGVTVENPFEFYDGGYHFQSGTIHLDGPAALTYSRMRYKDPRGDHGRNDRQRQIIAAMINEGVQLSTLAKVTKILNSIETNVRTDLTFDQMKKIHANYKAVIGTQETLAINGSGKIINGIWYYLVSEEEKNRLSVALKQHLEIE